MTARTIRTAAVLAALCTIALGRLEWQWLQPPQRSLATMVIDAPNQRIVIFGGGAGANYNDVWEMALDTTGGYGWKSMSISGTPPSGRHGHAAIFDPIHNWMVVYGGRSGYTAFNDVWALDLSTATWQQLSPSGTPPEGRVYITAVYSPGRRSMVLFGGNDIYNGCNEVHELLLDSMKWQEITPSGTPPPATPAW